MPSFQKGDKVRAAHPEDPLSTALRPGEVIATAQRRVPAGDVLDMVTVEFSDGMQIELEDSVVESVERGQP